MLKLSDLVIFCSWAACRSWRTSWNLLWSMIKNYFVWACLESVARGFFFFTWPSQTQGFSLKKWYFNIIKELWKKTLNFSTCEMQYLFNLLLRKWYFAPDSSSAMSMFLGHSQTSWFPRNIYKCTEEIFAWLILVLSKAAKSIFL